MWDVGCGMLFYISPTLMGKTYAYGETGKQCFLFMILRKPLHIALQRNKHGCAEKKVGCSRLKQFSFALIFRNFAC